MWLSPLQVISSHHNTSGKKKSLFDLKVKLLWEAEEWKHNQTGQHMFFLQYLAKVVIPHHLFRCYYDKVACIILRFSEINQHTLVLICKVQLHLQVLGGVALPV